MTGNEWIETMAAFPGSPPRLPLRGRTPSPPPAMDTPSWEGEQGGHELRSYPGPQVPGGGQGLSPPSPSPPQGLGQPGPHRHGCPRSPSSLSISGLPSHSLICCQVSISRWPVWQIAAAAVYGVAQSRTRLTRLSSSSTVIGIKQITEATLR